jgi:hypothetical protein
VAGGTAEKLDGHSQRVQKCLQKSSKNSVEMTGKECSSLPSSLLLSVYIFVQAVTGEHQRDDDGMVSDEDDAVEKLDGRSQRVQMRSHNCSKDPVGKTGREQFLPRYSLVLYRHFELSL